VSFQVSARKWRPQSFDEVSAQSHVTTPLRNAIASGRVPHAILLTGPRGVGKTTCARILARCLNCDNGPTDKPCGTCSACVEIAEGRSTDVQEVDAASRTSVDDVRGLIDSIRYAPSPGKHRIFVVDEVHMLSAAAFNALLKTLEEPPPSSLFVFATTNPEKIPFTVLSRCQRYDLRRISTKEIAARLETIASAEGVTISPSSMLAIAREGDGSMRDAQTLFDQVIAYSGYGAGGTESAADKSIPDEVVAEVLDLIDRRVLLEVLKACVDSDPAGALEACGRATSGGSDAKRVTELLIGALRDLVVLSVAPDSPGLVEGSEEEIADLRALAQQSEPVRLRRMFRALVKEQEDLAWAPDPLAVLEMALVRLATMPPGDDVARLLSRLEALEQRLAGGGGPPSGGGRGGGGRAPGPAAPPATSERPPATRLAAPPTREPRAQSRPEPAAAGLPPRPNDTPAPAPAGASPAPARSEATPPLASEAPPIAGEAPPLAGEARPLAGEARPLPNEARPPSSEAPPVPTEPASAAPASPAGAAEAPGIGAPLDVVFDRLRGRVRDKKPAVFAILNGMRLTAREPGRITLTAPSTFSRQRLEDKKSELEAICGQFFGEPTAVALDEEANASRPAAAPQREDARRLRHEALNHPMVNVALEVLEADIVEIKPLGDGPGRGPGANR